MRITQPIPTFCLAFARHILTMQTQVNQYCVVLSSLRINITNIVKASSLLTLELMQKGPNVDFISRSTTLDQIHRALTICRSSKVSKLEDFILITEMLSHEAKSFHSRQNIYNSAINDAFAPNGHNYDFRAKSNTHLASTNINDVQVTLSTPESNTTSSGTSNDDLSWTSLLPSDTGIYPGLLANTFEENWINMYDAFFAPSQ